MFSRFWEQKIRCLLRMAAVGSASAEVDLHLIAVFLKICSPNSVNQKKTTAENVPSCNKTKNTNVLTGNAFSIRHSL